MARRVKNPPAKKETQVWSLGWDDPLEKGWLPTPVFCPGECHGQMNLVGGSPRGHKESGMTEWFTRTHIHTLSMKLNGRLEICQVYSRAITILFLKRELPQRHYFLNVSWIMF